MHVCMYVFMYVCRAFDEKWLRVFVVKVQAMVDQASLACQFSSLFNNSRPTKDCLCSVTLVLSACASTVGRQTLFAVNQDNHLPLVETRKPS